MVKGDRPKRRLFRLLRRTVQSSAGVSGRSAVDENALWLAHERALGGAREAGEAAQRVASTLAKQRGAVDAVADRARAAAGRAQELSSSCARITDTFERLGIVGLNAGLEGARVGESAGQPLTMVGDEVRAHAGRGAETARELAAMLTEVATELGHLNASLERAREAQAEVAQEATRAGGAASDVERALADLGERLRKATGNDPETIRAIADATEHARSLVTALGALSGKVPQGLVVAALRPMLEPLVRLLADDEPAGDEGPGGDEAGA
jgi:methyl-accepting chemotaxis protein